MALAVRAAVGDAVGHLLQNFLHIGARADKSLRFHTYLAFLYSWFRIRGDAVPAVPCLFDMVIITREMPA